jgi:sugar/nucleoside kinase (ribokinase family)
VREKLLKITKMNKIDKLLHKFQNLNPVGVIGNLNVDLIIRNVPHLPKWGQEVLGTDQILVSSGQAGYLAFALSRLGVSASLIGNVGQDLYGDRILSDLRRFDLDLSGIEINPYHPTGIAVAIVRPDGERAFVTNLGSMAAFEKRTIERHWVALRKSSLVALVGLFMLPGLGIDGAIDLMTRAQREGKVNMLDTGWDPENWPVTTIGNMRRLLQKVHLFLPNLDEAMAITGEKTVEKALDQILSMGPELVIIKCGAEGSITCVNNKTIHVEARPVSVFDAVGAGDVFNAGLITALRWGWPVEACMGFGNTASSLYISRSEDRFPKLAEVLSTTRSTYSFIPDTP